MKAPLTLGTQGGPGNAATAWLIVKPGAAHGWPDMLQDIVLFGDWFDAHLRNQTGN
jgi:hypothetical protein